MNSDFKFSQGDPCRRIFHDPVLYKKRNDIIAEVITELKYACKVLPANQQNQQRKPLNYYNMDPLNVLEAMENDDEDELANIERFLARKAKKALQN